MGRDRSGSRKLSVAAGLRNRLKRPTGPRHAARSSLRASRTIEIHDECRPHATPRVEQDRLAHRGDRVHRGAGDDAPLPRILARAARRVARRRSAEVRRTLLVVLALVPREFDASEAPQRTGSPSGTRHEGVPAPVRRPIVDHRGAVVDHSVPSSRWNSPPSSQTSVFLPGPSSV